MIGGADLIICGRQTTDGDTAQVGPSIAEHLTIPHAAWVAEVTDVTDHSITVRQDLVSVSQVSELPYPCLITIEFLERELIDIFVTGVENEYMFWASAYDMQYTWKPEWNQAR